MWPTTNGVRRESKSFAFTLNGDLSKHSFVWTSTNLVFESCSAPQKSDRLDELYTAHPHYGVRVMTQTLRREGLVINPKPIQVRRLRPLRVNVRVKPWGKCKALFRLVALKFPRRSSVRSVHLLFVKCEDATPRALSCACAGREPGGF